jgi:CBS domain-containing protein
MQTAEDLLKDKKCEIVSIAHDQTVLKACQAMTEHKIGAILVRENDALAGIWTERDLLRHISTAAFDPATARVGDYMTTPLQTVSHATRLHKLSDMFLGLFVRHLLVEKEGEYIGLISIGDVLRANLLEADRRFKDVNDFVHWDYYENWRWGRKKRS